MTDVPGKCGGMDPPDESGGDSTGQLLETMLALDDSGWASLRNAFPDECQPLLDTLREHLPDAAHRQAEGGPPSEDPSRSLSIAQLHLRAIYDVLPVGITVTDESGVIIDINAASERLLGLCRDDHLGRDLTGDWQIFDENGRRMPVEEYAGAVALRTGQPVRDQIMQVETANGPVWLSVSATPIREAGLGVVIAYANISELVIARQQIEALAFYDVVTGLANRGLFLDRLRNAVVAALADGTSVAVLLLDLKGFSEINEANNHLIGDEILRVVSRRLEKTLPRSSNLARIYADGFAAVTRQPPLALAERALQAVQHPLEFADRAFRLDARIGLAIFPADGDTAESILKNAEIALWRAKQGGEPIRFYDQAMGERVSRRLELARRLEQALLDDGLDLYFQPQFDLSTRRLIGAEALLRWSDDEDGPISPGEFIPIAENRGLMPAIGRWVLKSACRQINRWERAGHPLPGRLAVNVSPLQLDQPDFVKSVLGTLSDHGTDPSRIELEITENTVAADPERAIEVLKALSEAGLTLAIDDFGMGYSSLSHLRRFQLHKLKIDQSFIERMNEVESDRVIVQTTIGMARSLGLETIAEGVETDRQAEALLEMGCKEAQGYLFGPPLPAEDFEQTFLGPDPS